MGRTKWFRSKDLLMVLRGATAVITALARFIAQHVTNNKPKKKGGDKPKKQSVKRRT